MTTSTHDHIACAGETLALRSTIIPVCGPCGADAHEDCWGAFTFCPCSCPAGIESGTRKPVATVVPPAVSAAMSAPCGQCGRGWRDHSMTELVACIDTAAASVRRECAEIAGAMLDPEDALRGVALAADALVTSVPEVADDAQQLVSGRLLRILREALRTLKRTSIDLAVGPREVAR